MQQPWWLQLLPMPLLHILIPEGLGNIKHCSMLYLSTLRQERPPTYCSVQCFGFTHALSGVVPCIHCCSNTCASKDTAVGPLQSVVGCVGRKHCQPLKFTVVISQHSVMASS